MRIAQIVSLIERVPPKKYGGTERVVSALTEELVKRGHEVTLFASGDSITSAKLISAYPISLREANMMNNLHIYTLMHGGAAYLQQDNFDIIHDHLYPPVTLPAAAIAKTKTVITWHGPYYPEVTQLFASLPGPAITSISHSQALDAPELKFTANVYNGLPMDSYPFSADHDDYLLFVGRVEIEKGLHLAMDVAYKLGKKLKVAAKLENIVPHIKHYYQRYIVPRRRKYGDLIEWIGEVDEFERNELMKRALCLLHPATWHEPFGLTMIEAMACGCPVVAFNKGSIPEVVADGKTGFIVDGQNPRKMAIMVTELKNIDRRECRRHALENFSAKKMADGYEAVYQSLLK